MSLGLVLFIAGAVICFLAFVAAAVNMGRGMTDRDPFSGVGDRFRVHIIAIIVMAFGGLLCLAGFAFAGFDITTRLLK